MCSASGPDCDPAEQEGLQVPWLLSDSSALPVGSEPSLSPPQLLSRYHRWRQADIHPVHLPADKKDIIFVRIEMFNKVLNMWAPCGSQEL